MELQTYSQIPQLERNVSCICNPRWGKFTTKGLFVSRESGAEEKATHPIAREGHITVPSLVSDADGSINGFVYMGYDEIRPCGALRKMFNNGSIISYLEMSVEGGNTVIARIGAKGSSYIQEPSSLVTDICLYKEKSWLVKIDTGLGYQMAVIGYNRSGFVQMYSVWDV